MLEYLVFVAVIIQVVSAILYIRDMKLGTARPNRITYLIWAVAAGTSAGAMLSSGAQLSALPALMSGLLPALILAASFLIKGAYWKLHIYDYVGGGLSVVALILWVMTKNPTWAIVFSILSDGILSAITIKKVYQYPESESFGSWMASLVASITTFFAIKEWNFVNAAWPIYYCASIVIILMPMIYDKMKKVGARGVEPRS